MKIKRGASVDGCKVMALYDLKKKMIQALKLIISCVACVILLGFASPPGLKNGTWRATLQRADGREIVFNFESKDSANKKIIYVLNADERLLVDSIKIIQDSVYIQMPFFESKIKATFDARGNMSGVWITQLQDTAQVMPFSAVYGIKNRFDTDHKHTFDVTGRWAVTFRNRKNEVTGSVGEFTQNGERLTGTFLNPTGDYRFLEGVVTGDSLKLSCFDGSHAFLFTAKVENDSTISGGHLYSGPVAVESWAGNKDEHAHLPDEYGLTKLRPGKTRLNFKFKSIDGQTVSISDNRFKNKVVIVQIMGSWCPNCMDETRFLSDYYNQHPQSGVEMVALAYERSTDFERSKASLKAFQHRFQVTYPILITGVTVSDTLRTEKTLPELEKIIAFPTSVFLDKKGNVRKIYSGFSGPGTGEHYEAFRKEFNDTVNALLNEK